MNAIAMMPNRRRLAERAMQAAIATRLKAKHDLVSPVCIYGLAQALGIRVTFNNINMEGMYQRGSPPRIHLSSLRPQGRRAYNCAHELGHHVLGHGSSIDELREHQTHRPWDVPDEYSADTFAAFLLMPTLGLRHAFVTRGITPQTASPLELYNIACEFGVGYASLVAHLLWGERMINQSQARALRAHTPKTIRANLLGPAASQPLIVVCPAWSSPTIDVEVGYQILTPARVSSRSDAIVHVADLPAGHLFEARRPGLAQLVCETTQWAAFGRVMRPRYVGRAEFRHLEDDPND